MRAGIRHPGGPLVAVCGLVGGSGARPSRSRSPAKPPPKAPLPVLVTESSAHRAGLAVLAGRATAHSLPELARQLADGKPPQRVFTELDARSATDRRTPPRRDQRGRPRAAGAPARGTRGARPRGHRLRHRLGRRRTDPRHRQPHPLDAARHAHSRRARQRAARRRRASRARPRARDPRRDRAHAARPGPASARSGASPHDAATDSSSCPTANRSRAANPSPTNAPCAP